MGVFSSAKALRFDQPQSSLRIEAHLRAWMRHEQRPRGDHGSNCNAHHLGQNALCCVTMSAMFGKKVKEYVRFERWILILIVVVFALRLGLSLAGVPVGGNIAALDGNYKATEWVSINLVLLVGILYCAIAVQTTGFGTYKH